MPPLRLAASSAGVRMPPPPQQQHSRLHRSAGRTVPAVLRTRPCCHPRRHAAHTTACAAPLAAPLHSTGPSAVAAPERLVAGVFSLWRGMLQWWGESCRRAAEVTRQAEAQQAVGSHLRRSFKAGRVLSSVAPFAAATSAGSADTLILVSRAVGSFIKLYLLLLFVRVLLSWFPKFEWDTQPWLALRQVTDPYLNLFRGLVPPLLGTIDFTPLFGFLILQFLAGALDIGSEDELW